MASTSAENYQLNVSDVIGEENLLDEEAPVRTTETEDLGQIILHTLKRIWMALKI